MDTNTNQDYVGDAGGGGSGNVMVKAKTKKKVGFAGTVDVKRASTYIVADNRSSMQMKSSCRRYSTLNTRSQYHFTVEDETEDEVDETGDDGNNESGDAGGEVKKKNCCGNFCYIMDTYPVTFVIVAAAIGIGLGIGLSFWKPDGSGKYTVIMWIGLLGDLFIRALKCVVLPLVFVSIAVSVMDMLSMGGAGVIVGTTIGLYVLTTICAAIIGVVTSLIFSPFFDVVPGEETEGEAAAVVATLPEVHMGCGALTESGESTHYLTLNSGGLLECVSVPMNETANKWLNNTFLLYDVNGHFEQSFDGAGPAKLSLGESLYEGLFMQMIDVNMIGMFVKANFLGTIILGAGFGVALTKLSKNKPDGVDWDRILTIQLLEELMEVFMLFIGWIIKITPFAIISLIAAAIGEQNDIGAVMEQLGYVMAAILIGFLMQAVIVYCGLYTIMVRKNPFSYLRQLTPAWLLAFASASSAATIPVSIDTVIATGQVSDGVARFVIPMGSSVNMDGGAIRIICNTVWLAYQNGHVPTVGDYIILVLCATLGSMGAAPVPSASLVLVITAYSTVFGATPDGGPPNGMAYLFAIEWLMDRFSTITNITGDMVVSAIIEDKVTKKVKKDAARDIGQAKKNDDITLGGTGNINFGDEELGAAAGGDNEGEEEYGASS